MILTDLFESPEIHDQDRLDQVLARCIEMVHEKNQANSKKYGKVAACIIDMKNRKVFGINSPGANGTRRHAERMAIDAYHKRYGKILPGAIIVTTLSPCNRDMVERDGPSCQDLLLQAGIEKVYSGYMDPSQHSDHPFTEEVTQNDDLWRRCKEFSDSFVHDDLTEGKVKLYTDPGHYGAELDNYKATGPVVNIPADQLVGFEPDSKMQQPKSKVNVKKIIAGIKQGDDIPPILVRKHKNGYQILDGHHRFHAYKLSGIKTIPAQIIPDSDIEEISKQGMAEDTQLPGDFKLMGQNLFLKNLARNLKQRYPDAIVKLSSDRVTAYHNEGDDEALTVMGTEVMDSGYIGVGLDDAFTESFQGVLVPTIKQTTEQLLRANPGTRPALFLSTDNWNPDAWTHIAAKLGYRLVADDESLDENFADGKNPGRKGLAKRSGVNTKASVSSLRKTAKNSSGEKQRMAHWLANMKAGRAKAKK
jgi:pyrimidine deaminase RibD-like protein